MANVDSVKLSEYNIVLNKDDKRTINAQVIGGSGKPIKGRVDAFVEDRDVVGISSRTVIDYSDRTDSSMNVSGVSAGKSSIRVFSTDDPSKYAVLNINVVDANETPGERVFIPYTIFANPTTITVQRNQKFQINVSGVGGYYKNGIIDYPYMYRNRWEFSVESTNPEAAKPQLYRVDNSRCGTIAFFVSDSPGTYYIHAYNPVFPEFGTKTCTVEVVDEIASDQEIELISSKKGRVEFLDKDRTTPFETDNYDADSCKIIFSILQNGEYVEVPNQLTEIGWKQIPINDIISSISNVSGGVRITKGTQYGIIPVTFYLKSNPYVYCPIFVELNRGPYEEYINMDSPAQIIIKDIELTETVTAIKPGDYAKYVYASAVDEEGNAIGHIKTEVLAGSTEIKTSLTRMPDGSYRISISASKYADEGIVYLRVYYEDDPSLSKLIVVHVVKDTSSYTAPTNGGESRVIGIELSRQSLVLVPRQTAHIKLVKKTNDGKVADYNCISESSNPDVARYTGGSASYYSNEQSVSVHAYEVGVADIIFAHKGNESIYAILHVVVVASQEEVYNPVLDVSVSESEVTVSTSSTFSLTGQQVSDGSVNRTYASGSYQIVVVESAASLIYSGNVRFESGNPAIARISRTYSDSSTNLRADIVTGASAGITTIYVISNDDPEKTAACIVKVEEPQTSPWEPDSTNPVVSVSITEDNVEIAEGEYHQLTAVVTGQFSDQSNVNRSVTWSSSNGNVVGVDSNGVIVGFSVGTSIVTAVSVDNSNAWGSCRVTVRAREESDGPIIVPGEESVNGIDRIIRVDYKDDGTFELVKLFEGDLNFDSEHPIESVVYHETDEIQKIYWVDGKNVLRFMNFMEEPDEATGLYPWQISADSYDNTYFDSNRSINFSVDVKVSKDNSGNARPNGVIQYLLTYYNKHGQESGYAWISDLIYLSPVSSGGAADGTNNNSVSLTINNLDTRFSHFRIYSVLRSALNGTTVSYIVFEGKTTNKEVTVIDNNSHLTAIDSSRLLYLGSQHVVADTLTHKDQTLFLGNFSSVGRDYDNVEKTLRKYMISDNGWESINVRFVYDSNEIPNKTGDGNYSYNSQLVKSSSEITSFKGGEKYRFGIIFHKKDGTLTDAFWIGDKVNKLYPKMSDEGISRIIAECTLPREVVAMMSENDFSTAQLVIAEATYADRSIKAQGIVCPTVFNVWNRYMNRIYSASSWMMRPRNAEYAWKHFEPIHNSTFSTGEIDCNYWETENDPVPYYSLNNYATSPGYSEKYEKDNGFDYALIVYYINYTWSWYNDYSAGATVILVKNNSGNFNPETFTFSGDILQAIIDSNTKNVAKTVTLSDEDVIIQISNLGYHASEKWLVNSNKSKEAAYNGVVKAIRDKFGFLDSNSIVTLERFGVWCQQVNKADTNKYFIFQLSGETYDSISDAVNDTSSTHGMGRWISLSEETPRGDVGNYIPSYYKKHLVFVDENVITLNSPEIEYEAISLDNVDGYKFRIVGVAKIDGQYNDYTVAASPGKLSGENLIREHLSNTLIAWPLWREYGLDERSVREGSTDKYVPSVNIEDRESYDYIWGGSIVRYWLRMWNHSDKINGFTDYAGNEYSRLNRKVFANARFSNRTVYNNFRPVDSEEQWSCTPNSIRTFNYTSSQYVGIMIGNELKNYEGNLNDSLMMPRNYKYPVLLSLSSPDTDKIISSDSKSYLYLSDPVNISYRSGAHAVITLPSSEINIGGRINYEQTILPKIFDTEDVSILPSPDGSANTGFLLPWRNNASDLFYPYKDYKCNQDTFKLSNNNEMSGLSGCQYVYIGEIYYDFDDFDQVRYGGTSDSAIQNNRFIVAGPQYSVSKMIGNGSDIMIANQSDTYIQRWDCLKTKPLSSDCANNVIDITSVMLETHINIDGRTDLQRGTSYIASIDAEKFGQINPVYSQNNNFITQRDLDEDFNIDAYGSSITWTLEKHDSEDIDEWSHITLASTLKLDGDKGVCRALRRMGNSVIAFQDRGISEILFNSRTQLSTQDGVPVEIANSGKVDGKRYITNKYGCVNKWSIVEGKNALYFVDNINKAFCSFNGQAIDNLSTRLGFGAWFREINNIKSWNPKDFNNIVSYYDKVHSDIYLVRGTDDDKPCLVYNETLGAFTSFFDYKDVLMMANVDDRFISFSRNALWLQNEGPYCNFFGKQFDYWTQYRVTPEPFSDKIWTNIDYRADFFEVLDEDGDAVVPETSLINGNYGDFEDTYKKWETFTDFKVWDEYQDTGFTPFAHEDFDRDDVRKKFRIWRLVIPRALKEGTNKHGMDRIRNPWINLLFRKNDVDGKYLMQLHDIVVKYFE